MGCIGQRDCNVRGMTINPISSLPLTLFPPANNNQTTSLNPTSVTQTQNDSPDISPAARFLSALQQIQQQDPSRFQQILSQITAQLQTAATNAASQGNSTRADQLNQLATQFQSAASNGQLPSVQTLQQAGLTGHHGHHGGHHHGGGQTSQTNPLSAFQQTADADSQSTLASIFTQNLQS
jgi:hypothetical protein